MGSSSVKSLTAIFTNRYVTLFNTRTMRQLLILVLLLVLFFPSCKKGEEPRNYNEEPCNYNIATWASDTTLYISYEINGETYKYYQVGSYGTLWGSNTMDYNETKKIDLYPQPVGFGKIYNEEEHNINIYIDIMFWNYTVYDKNSIPSYLMLSETIDAHKSYCHPPDPFYDLSYKFSISDTVFMTGISIGRVGGLYSTENVMKYYNFNLNSIKDFYKNSNFTISSIEPVCNNYYIVKGTFETKIMYQYQPFDIKNIENGQFRFLIK